MAWGDWDGDGDLDLAAGDLGAIGDLGGANRVCENGWLRRPGGLPETPVSPALPDRPGATDAAFFFSASECLHSPVTVEYILTDEESDPALRIVPEYSVAGGAGWRPAAEGPGGSGTTDLRGRRGRLGPHLCLGQLRRLDFSGATTSASGSPCRTRPRPTWVVPFNAAP